MACVKLFLADFAVSLLSSTSLSSSLLALGWMLARNSNNIWCLPCHPWWQATAAVGLLGWVNWGEAILMVLRRVRGCHWQTEGEGCDLVDRLPYGTPCR